MPPLERLDLKREAVLREVRMSGGIALTNDYGETLVGPPVQVYVQWEETRREARDPYGTPTVIEADVIIDQEVGAGSIMRLGLVEDETGTGGDDVSYMKVVGRKCSTDLRGRYNRCELELSRFRGKIAEDI